MALVLTRKPGETVILTVGDEEIFISVGRLRKSDVRLHFTASDKVHIVRAEAQNDPVESEQPDE